MRLLQLISALIQLHSLHGKKCLDCGTLYLYVIVEHLFLKPSALICCSNNVHSSGTAFCKILEPGCGHFAPRYKSIIEFGWWYWTIRPGSNSSQRCQMVLRWHQTYFLMDLALCTGVLSHGTFHKVVLQNGSTLLSKISLNVVASRFIFPKLELGAQTTEKISPSLWIWTSTYFWPCGVSSL